MLAIVVDQLDAPSGGSPTGVSAALDLLDHNEQLDGAVVDLKLQGEMACPTAVALMERHLLLVLSTGYDLSAISPRYRKAGKADGNRELCSVEGRTARAQVPPNFC